MCFFKIYYILYYYINFDLLIRKKICDVKINEIFLQSNQIAFLNVFEILKKYQKFTEI